ncbi:MAG TPA: lasso peptide biosynthesis B2 protein [Gemmatimonadales bacterium]|nr:lasso peptide biosynthesis B2 protein [Gemmatimonadales bacterium]
MLLIGAVRVGLALLPFHRLRHLLAWLASGAARHPAPARRIAWAVAAAGRHLPGATCLIQALSAQTLLARHGHAARLRIGVARANGGIAAHAWLERDGQPLFGEPAGRHPVLVLDHGRSA